MRVFLTGGTGFVGGVVARKLRERGDDVVALVRSPGKAGDLKASGCQIASGDLGDEAAIREAMAGCDAAIHAAASYEGGVMASEHPRIYDANVRGTERVLSVAKELGVKVVYVSTVGVLGNTDGQVVDENYARTSGYLSYYEETKHQAHEVAERLMAEGLECIIVMPGGIYGPGDTSDAGKALSMFLDGKMPMKLFPEAGFTFAHVDDIADGILLALDKGRVGEKYILAGEVATLGDVIDTAGKITGRKPPKYTLPAGVVKAIAPFGRVIGPLMGMPPNLREVVASLEGVTYWARADKAMNELGFSARPLEQGLRDTLKAEGRL